MKKSVLFVALLAIFAASCEKEQTTSTPSEMTLDVEQKNMVLVAKHTWTGCQPCGEWGFETFENLIENYPDECHISFTKGSLINETNFASDITYALQDSFNLPGATPTFHNNLKDGSSVDAERLAMDERGVIANANYDFTREGGKLKVFTTTQFFQNAEGQYLLAPYLVLKKVYGPQLGHADTPNTEHHYVAVDVARPLGHDAAEKGYVGYKVAEGNIKAGYKVNVEFEVEADPSWSSNNISFALMLIKKNNNGSYELINTFTK